MRLGIITDVHSNTEGLSAVLGEFAREGIDTIVHLGDVVGYGAEPNECCRTLRQAAQISLMGNHDAAVVGQMDTVWFASHARAAVEWTVRNLDADNLEWLAKSPYTYREGAYFFSHASPVKPSDFRYVMSQFDADEIFAHIKRAVKGVRVVFVGHAHQCFAFHDHGEPYQVLDGIQAGEADLSEGNWVINVGSAGQPRDGDPRACYAILDTETGHYRACRVAYDFVETGRKIREAGLPEILSSRLTVGR